MQSVAHTIQGMLVAVPRVSSFRGASKLLSMTDRIVNPHASPVAIRVMAQGHRLKLDRRCQAEKWAYYTGRYDCEDLELLCRLLRPGDTVCDVGGNVGFYAVPIASRLQHIGGHLHTFEPVKANFTRLQENIALNGLQACATVHEYALSSRAGTAEITLREDFLAGSGTGNAAMVFSESDKSRFSVERIALRRLDDLGEEMHLDRLDLIKLDIEGHEDEFLRGGAGMITRHLPIIYMEVNKAYYRWRGVDLWDACSETVGTGHIAILPKWRRRAAWSVEKRLVGFQRVNGLSACAEIDNIFLVPLQRMADFSAIAPISD
jgi:FkbM family methyltransferase